MPGASRVEKAVQNGVGQMPVFKKPTDGQLKILSEHVAVATGAGK